MVFPLIGAAIGLGTSIAGSVAQNNSINASNQAAINNYKTQLKIREDNWTRTTGIWASKLGTYNDQLKENEVAASKAYASQQQRLNNLYKSYAFGLQDAQIKRVQKSGVGAAAGKSGRSIQRLDRMAEAMFFRTKAKGLATLKSGNIAFDVSRRNIGDQLKITNRNAWSQVSVAPMPTRAPQAPVMREGVNPFVAGLGAISSGLSGYQQGQQFGYAFEEAFQ